jgi:hypothetical protein
MDDVWRWLGDEHHEWSNEELERRAEILNRLMDVKLEPWQERFFAALKDAAVGEMFRVQLYSAGRATRRWEHRVRLAAEFALEAMRKGSAVVALASPSGSNVSSTSDAADFERTLRDLLNATGWVYTLTRDPSSNSGTVSLLLVVSDAGRTS